MTRCACGEEHDSLLDLPRVEKYHGLMSWDGEVLLLVNCTCGSTLAIVLVPHRDDVLARLEGLHDEFASRAHCEIE
jgi:hypothetical protein